MKLDCGGATFGSGTHGLQSLTRSPPPIPLNSAELTVRVGSVAGGAESASSVGGRTMYWCGMVIRWGEQELQTTLPHFLKGVNKGY